MNNVQKLHADLLEISSFNNFDGLMVRESLEENSDLWHGFVMARPLTYLPLLPLRDIQDNINNVDTLYITVKEGKEKEMEQLANTWGADEVYYMSDEDNRSAVQAGYKILIVWWD